MSIGDRFNFKPPLTGLKNKSVPNTALIFDVNETLLDLAPLKSSVGKALGGREELVPLWFSTILHYSLVETQTGSYHSLGEIGTATLMMVAKAQGIELKHQDAKAAVVTPILSLPPHDDVAAVLKCSPQTVFGSSA